MKTVISFIIALAIVAVYFIGLDAALLKLQGLSPIYKP